MRAGAKAALAGGLVLAAGGAAYALAGPSPSAGPLAGADQTRMVLISGRDDHGLLASASVGLHARPEKDAATIAQVPNGTLARVLATRGTWLRVQAAEGSPAQGWIDDFYLRGTVHLVGPPPTCQVSLGGTTLPEGEQAVVLDLRGGQVQVRVDSTGATGWADRAAAREIVPERCQP